MSQRDMHSYTPGATCWLFSERTHDTLEDTVNHLVKGVGDIRSGSIVSLHKTGTIHQPSPDAEYVAFIITIN